MHKCNDLHVWGAPTFVLDPTLQDGKKLPQWKPRSRRAVFVGFSPKHATTIPLVVNLATGTISPQFHCVFDDWFSTVFSDPDRIQILSNLLGQIFSVRAGSNILLMRTMEQCPRWKNSGTMNLPSVQPPLLAS
jgi:hypothetical protein